MYLYFCIICIVVREATKIEWRYTDSGEKVRVSIRTGRIIPIPLTNQETVDYKLPHIYREQPKDTIKSVVEKLTFKVLVHCNLYIIYNFSIIFVQIM